MPFTIAHSPDSDDAYMMAPLALGWLDPEGFDFRFVRKDIETLNTEALEHFQSALRENPGYALAAKAVERVKEKRSFRENASPAGGR